MKNIRLILTASLAILLTICVTDSPAQRLVRLSDTEMKSLLERIERDADRFRNSLNEALDRSRFDDTRSEDNINQFIRNFEAATDRLEDRFDDDRSASSAVREVLTRASSIDDFLMRHRLTPRAHSDWDNLRRSLDELAQAYNVSWSWAGISNEPFRLDDKQVKNLLERIERGADSFRGSLKSALERSRFDDTDDEDDINSFIREFERATDQLEDRFSNKRSAASDAEEVLRRADRIDDFMRRHGHNLTPRANSDWDYLRRNLDELALAYRVSWQW